MNAKIRDPNDADLQWIRSGYVKDCPSLFFPDFPGSLQNRGP
jgi:hypothetical protein